MTGLAVLILSSTELSIKCGPNSLPRSYPDQAASVEVPWPLLPFLSLFLTSLFPSSNIILLGLYHSKAIVLASNFKTAGVS